MKKFKELTQKLKESRYGDAMTSRLPAHLDDPRVEKKPKKMGQNFPLAVSPKAAKPTLPMKESVWEAYRDRALSEAKEHTPPKSVLHPDKWHQALADTRKDHPTQPEHAPRFWQHLHNRYAELGGKTSMKEEAPHPGRVMDFHDRMEHSYHGGAEAKKDRDAFAAHLKAQGHTVKKSSTPNQILHGTWGNVYTVSHKRPMTEETEREAASHANRMTPHVIPHSESDEQVKKQHTEREKNKASYEKDQVMKSLKESTNTYAIGDHVVPKIGPHQGQVHRVIHVHPTGHVNITPVKPGKNHYQLGAARAHPKDLEDAPGHGSKKLQESTETYKVGDKVIPKIGPHKGQIHSVIHVHPTGHLNITPESRGIKNRYHLGAAKAHPDDVTRHLEESTLLAGREEKPLEKTTGWLKNRGNQFHKWPAGVKLHNVNPLTSRKTVREAFEDAKAKKVKANDFKEPKDLKSKDDQDPQQTEVSAAPPQFGGKDNEAPEKKDNTPKPEKKGNKLVVKGPGVDDKFQPDPIVTPLTTMPDTASPKSGSQGVR